MEIRELVLNKIEVLKNKFEEVNQQVKERTEKIDEIQKEVGQLVDSQKLMQGEFKATYEIGVELGILDKEANIVEEEEDVITETVEEVETVEAEIVQ